MYHPKLDEGCDIKIVGIGGAGLSIVSHMCLSGIVGAQCIVMNTEAATLVASPCQNKVLLGHGRLERGPSLGRQSVLESDEDVRAAIFDARLLILVGGLGGNTATSALPLIVQMAKEMDIFVVCMVIMPLEFEGRGRRERAKEGMELLGQIANNIIVFQSEHFLQGLPKTASIADGYKIANDMLLEGACYIAGLLDLDTGDIDKKDFQYIKLCISNHDFFRQNRLGSGER